MHSADQNHRHCFLLQGDTDDIFSSFVNLTSQQSTLLIAAHDVTVHNQLNVSKKITTVSFSKVKNSLGQSYDGVLIDLTDGISASALAILAGTVKGGGVFALALPSETDHWLIMDDAQMARHLPWPLTPNQAPSYFKRYFLNQLNAPESPFKSSFNTTGKLAPLPEIKHTPLLVKLTQEQLAVQRLIQNTEKHTHVLIAPRGRGKSTLLGDTLATWQKQGLQVATTAPNTDALVSLKAQFEQASAYQDSQPTLPFYAPDALLLSDKHWDHLIVDEAARLPIPLLEGLLKKANHCVFSTTDYGYEGAGKGFGLRFCRFLEHHSKPLKHLTLQQPIRWGENDPLENWVNQLFFLSPPLDHKNTQIQTNNIRHQAVKGKDWLHQPERLEAAFQLLVNAHYQTSPDNLRWILDDPSVTTWLSLSNEKQINSIAIVTEEGGLPADLSREVMEGTRRPRGHLLPQSLLAHEGIEEAGAFHYWRISRIATQAEKQGLGLASNVVKHMAIEASKEVDFLCTSYAASPEIVRFWKKNGFYSVRLGTSKDQASGCYSLMMVKPLNDGAIKAATRWQTHFYKGLVFNLLLQYQDLSAELIIGLLSCSTPLLALAVLELTPQDQQNLILFSQAHRPFDTLRPTLFKIITQLAIENKLDAEDPMDCHIIDVVLGKNTQKQKNTTFSRKALHRAIKYKILTNG